MFENWVIILDDVNEESIKIIYTNYRNRYCETFNNWQYV